MLAGIPCWIRNFTTSSALAWDSSQFDGNWEVEIGILSVWPSICKIQFKSDGIESATSIIVFVIRDSAILPSSWIFALPESNKISDWKINLSPLIWISSLSAKASDNLPKNSDLYFCNLNNSLVRTLFNLSPNSPSSISFWAISASLDSSKLFKRLI